VHATVFASSPRTAAAVINKTAPPPAHNSLIHLSIGSLLHEIQEEWWRSERHWLVYVYFSTEKIYSHLQHHWTANAQPCSSSLNRDIPHPVSLDKIRTKRCWNGEKVSSNDCYMPFLLWMLVNVYFCCQDCSNTITPHLPMAFDWLVAIESGLNGEKESKNGSIVYFWHKICLTWLLYEIGTQTLILSEGSIQLHPPLK
jgi:hypothetical protein